MTETKQSRGARVGRSTSVRAKTAVNEAKTGGDGDKRRRAAGRLNGPSAGSLLLPSRGLFGPGLR